MVQGAPQNTQASIRTEVETVDEQNPILLPDVPRLATSRNESQQTTETHVIYRIMSHRRDPDELRYRIRWYGHAAIDHT